MKFALTPLVRPFPRSVRGRTSSLRGIRRIRVRCRALLTRWGSEVCVSALLLHCFTIMLLGRVARLRAMRRRSTVACCGRHVVRHTGKHPDAEEDQFTSAEGRVSRPQIVSRLPSQFLRVLMSCPRPERSSAGVFRKPRRRPSSATDNNI